MVSVVNPTRRSLTVTSLAAAALAAGSPRAQARRGAVVIARGGASAGWPAGSRGAYEAAIVEGADFLESGVVPAKDGVLIARADDELSVDTDVASRAEFAARRATRVIDGVTRQGWFCEDFTAAELKSLSLVLPGRKDARPTAQRGQAPAILTFDELIAIARLGSVRQARVVGVCARLVHPTYFATLELLIEPMLGKAVRAQGYNSPAAAMLLVGAEAQSLKALAEHTRARRLLAVEGAADLEAAKGLTGLYGLAAPAGAVLDTTNPKSLAARALVAEAHGVGLAVHAWAGGLDEPFPPAPLKAGDARRALAALFAIGADGVCADAAGPAAKARAEAHAG
jgi:glycerophosphoryl diester phosphodiesterase